MHFHWKNFFDFQFWRSDYSYIQRTIRSSGLIAVAFHFPLYLLGEFVLHHDESLTFRIVVWLMAVPLLFFPKDKPLSSAQKIHWELTVHVTLVTLCTYHLLLNNLNQTWSYTVTAMALMYGLLAKPGVTCWGYPLFVGIGILLFKSFHPFTSGEVFHGVWVFAHAAIATLVALGLRVHSEALFNEVQRANRRLKDLDAQKTQFFQNISHEFRTPLTLILGPLDDILGGLFGPISAELRHQAEAMRRNANRLLNLINQLLDLARIEARQTQLLTTRIEVVSFVREIVATFESLAKRKEIQLDFRADVEKVDACLDAEKLETVLVNLLSNAFKFTEAGGKIHCMLRVQAHSLELTIQDTGGGIAAEQLPLIFDRFRQADSSTTRKHEGTGIGLSLVREFVKLHHGEITVSSEEGFGTRFQVVLARNLPATAPGLEEKQTSRPKASSRRELVRLLEWSEGAAEQLFVTPRDGAENGKAGSLLVVEDNKDMQSYICHCLDGHGFQIHVAGNGKEGLETARSAKPDLILSDVMMPEMDGYQLLKAIREDRETQHIPVIMLTARASQELKVEGLEAGAIDFLSKPFDRGEIVARVANLMALKRMSRTVDSLQRELAESAFKRYLPPELVGKILAGELQFDEEPKTITATVLFSDLVGFTTLSANLRASKTAKLLNEYLTAMNEVIFEHCGTVDKFMGDGIMVIFGAPREMSLQEQSRNATACALRMQRRVQELNEDWSRVGLPKLSMRIGLHQGPVVVGHFGSDKRVEYTAIGSTVNLASRIEGVCEPGRVYLSGEICDSLSETEFEEAGTFNLKGVPGEVRLFRL